MHNSSYYSPQHQEEAGKDGGPYSLILDPAPEDFLVEPAPYAPIIYLDVYDHHNCHNIHKHKNSQGI
jgi:hypothetical protein